MALSPSPLKDIMKIYKIINKTSQNRIIGNEMVPPFGITKINENIFNVNKGGLLRWKNNNKIDIVEIVSKEKEIPLRADIPNEIIDLRVSKLVVDTVKSPTEPIVESLVEPEIKIPTASSEIAMPVDIISKKSTKKAPKKAPKKSSKKSKTNVK